MIDAEINAKLEQMDLEAAPPATADQKLRRISYLLTGLPPTVAEREAYLLDTSQTAYATWIDHYLASPRFGERWARHWMDLMRYADTQGHEFDYEIEGAWQYRDYLIRAFNQDLPYDQFVREHLAGDLLHKPRLHPQTQSNESVKGTIYMALGEGKHSPVSIKQEEADRIDNTIDVTTKSFLGLTVACARCHDHKFDPIPTADYYRLYGLFETARIHRYSEANWLALQKDRQQMDSLHQFLQAQSPTISPQSNAWPEEAIVWADFRDGEDWNWVADGPAFSGGNTAKRPIISPSGNATLPRVGSMRSDTYGKGVAGALRSPNFLLQKDAISFRIRGEKASLRLIIDNFQLIQFPIYGQLEQRIDRPQFQTITIDNLQDYQGHKAYLEIIPAQSDRHRLHTASEAWVEIAWAVEHESALVFNPPKVFAYEKPPNFPIPKHLHPDTLAWSSSASPSYFKGVSSGPAVYSPIFIRGQVDQPSDSSLRHGNLSALGGQIFAGEGDHRLNFAEAILHPDNPLAARVMVNRLWQHVFGRGLVATPDNFGLQGKLPSHPELLDALAVRFREGGWSIKQMLREFMLSEAFQRASVPQSGTKSKDPNNQYLSHFSIRRLEAEAIRDGILATAGCLDTMMYGPNVAIHLTAFMQGRGRPARSGPLDGMGRRSVYQGIRRNFLPPFLQAFDLPVPFTAFGKRNVSNVPAQSLSLMNDPFVQEQASYWAERVLQLAESDSQRIERLYQEAFSRSAKQTEIQTGLQFVQQQCDLYPQDIAAEQKAWADYTHTLFNLKEFIYLL
ncbi:MAG: DUF1549 and DUF1553 domain-containing protein [Bacteroidota bacterium]